MMSESLSTKAKKISSPRPKLQNPALADSLAKLKLCLRRFKHHPRLPATSCQLTSQQCLQGKGIRCAHSDARRSQLCRSLKDLSRTINTSSATLTLPLPEDLLDVINAYVEKHAVYDDSDEKRLQEELINIYQTSIIEHPSRLAPFLSILRLLKPALRVSGRLLQWWDKLSPPIMVHLGVEKGLASEVKSTLLSILVYDEDEEDSVRETARATSVSMVENLISTWLAKIKLAAEEFDDHAKFVEGQIQLILLAFGKKRPKVSRWV